MSAPTRREIEAMVRETSARFTGRERGPDRGVRRFSYDEDDPRANPWSRVGDGSAAQGFAHIGARLQALRTLFRLEREMDEEGRRKLYGLGYTDPVPAPLQKSDLWVYEALCHFQDFMTGRCFPALVTIAEKAMVCRNTVIGALKRLKLRGFVTWVRRSRRTANEGEFAPQREQTSNAYDFMDRARVAPRIWADYAMLLLVRLKRCTTAPRPPSGPPREPGVPRDPGLAASLASLGAHVARAST